MENGLGAAGPWQVPYAPAPAGAHLPVDLLTFADLRRMDSTGRRRRPQRPSFHVLALVESGHGTHRLDFVDEHLGPRTVVHVHPGAVHQWTDVDTVDGLLVLFTQAAAEVDLTGWVDAPRARRLEPDEWALVRVAADHLRVEHERALQGAATHTAAIVRHTLQALVLRADARTEPSTPDTASGVFRAFRQAVEHHHRHWRHVSDYASALGYSPRTLSRATIAATGVGAKRFLDQRVVLEAKRLLAHTDLTVAQCAARLGFTQAANFTAFFAVITGESPSRWRAAEKRDPRTG